MALVVSRGQVTGPRRLGLLPAEATSFVGRKIELAGITALLGTARMVTVVGPAGVGKTRLSLRAAAAAGQFTDGVWLADLAGVSDPDLLVPTVAAVLGLPREDDAAQGAALLGYLRDKRLLLILDTCEHLVDACAALRRHRAARRSLGHLARHQPAAARRPGGACLPAGSAARRG